jgi:hypothetical protein
MHLRIRGGTIVAPHRVMKLLTRLLLMGSASLAGALVIDALRPKRRPSPEPELDLDLDIEDATIIAEESGLSDVDPQPLTHTAGEGIVPGEDEEARENVQGVRDRLPTARGR